MRRYKQIEYKAGITIEVIKCIPRGSRKGEQRQPVKKKTKEEIREANARQAARKLMRKVNANFRPGDWHVVLTYPKGERPTPAEARGHIKTFLRKLRDEYKKHGLELKYIQATEYLNKAIHHHIIINNVNDGKETSLQYVNRIWGSITKGHPKYVPLYDEGEYRKLADYFVKETDKTFRNEDSPTKQRYSCSRNLKEPKVSHRINTTKNGWMMIPRPRPGYYIIPDALYNGEDKLGYPYQRYVMVKLNPTDKDWEPCSNWGEEDGYE